MQRILKNFKSGLELEFCLLKNDGSVSFKADRIIQLVKKEFPKAKIQKEVSYNMVEINNYPEKDPVDTLERLFISYDALKEISEKNNIYLLQIGCYPGNFKPKMRKEGQYFIKKIIFKEKFEIAGKNFGFHFHYTMPRGVLDKEKLELKLLIDSKLKRMLLNAYNLLIALDPALCCLMASSPYYQGKYYGKDSRVFWYRGGKKLKFNKGLYAEMPLIGSLPPYKQTLADLKFSIKKRVQFWKRLMKKNNLMQHMKDYNSILEIYWGPVRINKHDTLEQRGMDMNFLDNIMAITVSLNFILHRVQHGMLEVVPSDIGLEEPFKIEGNVLHIPPHTHVRNFLQYYSALEGFSNTKIYSYVKRFYFLAKKSTPKEMKVLLKPIADMLDKKQSLSDKIIKIAKRNGFRENLPNYFAKELAIKIAEKGYKAERKTKKLISKFL